MSVERTLFRAQRSALSRDERIDTLTLNPLRRGISGLSLVESIVSASTTLTMDGASTLDITIHDPEWVVERSLVVGGEGRMNAVRVMVDGIAFRLVKMSRKSPTTLGMSFEDEVVALLKTHDKPMAASRGSVTRAQFVERMVREVKARDIEFFAPERFRKQPVELPDFPDAAPSKSSGETGFDDGTRFKVKGVTADAAQMRNAATLLGTADTEGAKGRAREALIVSAIGESDIRDIPNSEGSAYGGVLQALKTRHLTTAQQAHYFLKGGQGFQAGGAIAAAREHPDWSPGDIATAVEASGKPGSFYQDHIGEARKIIAAWGSADSDTTSDVVRVKQFQFTRGQNGKRENSWEAGERLAEEVQWRFFAMGGVVWFVSDDYLISQRASLTVDLDDTDWLIEPPTYDWDRDKPIAQVDLRVVASRWAVRPGLVVTLRDMGPITGRWIVETVEQDLLDATETQVTLVKPQPAKKEPAPEITTRADSTRAADGPAGAQRAIKWARSKIGHYAEEWGQNRGRELDDLEAGFGFKGAPWCAIFATSALVEGGVPRDCRTAAVAQIREWVEAGTHGYERGLRANPRPGDLMLFGTAHVAFVEKVNGDSLVTIEGNSSANKVARLTRVKSSGEFARPDYPN